jgi:glycosyltransferase involved in cell wall biosynthesis
VNILAITSNNLFPHSRDDSHGIFFANFLRGLLPHVEKIVVVAPQARIPRALQRLHPSLPARVPFHCNYLGIEVYRPLFLSFAAKRCLWVQGRLATAAILPLCRRLHRRHAFDLVLGQGFFGISHAVVSVADDLGCPCVNRAIGDDVNTVPDLSAENAALLRHDVRRSGLVLTVSAALREVLLRRVPGARHVHVLYRGTDLAFTEAPRPDRGGLRRCLGLSPDRTYMMTAGEINGQKGSEEFYQAFRELALRRRDLSAVWVGEGPHRRPLRERAQRDGLGDRLVLPGQTTRAEVLRYMQAGDVMAFASHREGLANVLLEALAAGLPVVATRVGGAPEIIVDAVSGRLVPPRDAPALAAAVEWVLQDPARARRLAERGRDFVRTYFDVRANARVAAGIFADLLAGKDPTLPPPVSANMAVGRLPVETLAGGSVQ